MPDYMFLLESRLSPEQRAAMMRVQELSAALGFNVYLTGGTVRDLITGASLRDLDFTVEGNPSRIARELEKGGAKVLVEDEKLREVELLFAGDCDGSISAARDDHYVRPGTRPEIRWSTIMEDLRRRDFSLNAIAISLNPAARGHAYALSYSWTIEGPGTGQPFIKGGLPFRGIGGRPGVRGSSVGGAKGASRQENESSHRCLPVSGNAAAGS